MIHAFGRDILSARMRHFTGTEKGELALAIVFVIGGLCIIVHPIEMTIFNGASGRYGGSGVVSIQHVSKEQARYGGGVAALLGMGFASFVLYRARQ